MKQSMNPARSGGVSVRAAQRRADPDGPRRSAALACGTAHAQVCQACLSHPSRHRSPLHKKGRASLCKSTRPVVAAKVVESASRGARQRPRASPVRQTARAGSATPGACRRRGAEAPAHHAVVGVQPLVSSREQAAVDQAGVDGAQGEGLNSSVSPPTGAFTPSTRFSMRMPHSSRPPSQARLDGGDHAGLHGGGPSPRAGRDVFCGPFVHGQKPTPWPGAVVVVQALRPGEGRGARMSSLR